MTANNPDVMARVDERKAVRLHLTNVVGMGAVRLLQSLLPKLVTQSNCRLEEVYLPTSGEISTFTLFEKKTTRIYYKRFLPKSISRLLECTLLGGKFDGVTPLFVFGDIPIKCKAKQTVFVQTTLLVRGTNTGRQLGAIRYWIARWLFQRNMQYVSNFIVQTEVMKTALIKSYPEIIGRIHVIAQPAPSWLIGAELKRTKFHSGSEEGLSLFYPAASYPHKNHQILSEIKSAKAWPVSELILTIPDDMNPNRSVSWLRCVGKLEPNAVLDMYRITDALLFLSFTESFGFPLVEAMWLGLPIICPDLPYARTLCGEQAIYFDPHKVDSLHVAIIELANRRNTGWWPDWSTNLEKIPRDWEEVAEAMLRVATT